MENKIICSSCGTLNEENARICSKCGAFLVPKEVETNINNEDNSVISNQQTITNNVNNTINNDNSDGNKLGIISLILYFVGPTIIELISTLLPESVAAYVSILAGLCIPAAVVTMIIGRISYPKNNLLKIVMWIIIAMTICAIILSIIFIVACASYFRKNTLW